jgi:hypothetical protein
MYLIIYLFTYLFISLLTSYLPTNLLTHLLTYLLTYSLTYLLTYSLTYLLTHSMQQSPSWEANSFSASQEISLQFMEPEGPSPYPQVPATFPYPEPTPSSPCFHISLPENPSSDQITVWNSQGSKPGHGKNFSATSQIGPATPQFYVYYGSS